MFHAYWLTSVTKLEDCQSDGYVSVEDAIFDCLEYWHEDESQVLIIIRAGEDGPIVATIASDPNERTLAIITRLCSGTIDRYNVEYIVEDGEHVGTSIEPIND